jgi:hypothetical protein
MTAILAREETSSLLRFRKKPDWLLIPVIRYYGGEISVPLLRSLIESAMDSRAIAIKCDEMVTVFYDTVNLGWQLGIADGADLVAACTDWRKLSGLHEEWTRRLNNEELDTLVKKYGEKLPPPPLPGAEDIQPVDSVRELLLEGRLMRHCVGGYIDKVRSGKCYIYRITAPERATLEILRDEAGAWVQGQLKSYYNSSPSKDVFRLTREWLCAAMPGNVAPTAASLNQTPRARPAGQARPGQREYWLPLPLP